jgi:hypothetical protein
LFADASLCRDTGTFADAGLCRDAGHQRVVMQQNVLEGLARSYSPCVCETEFRGTDSRLKTEKIDVSLPLVTRVDFYLMDVTAGLS